MVSCDSKVAVLLATYNGEEFLREQVDSLLTQTFQDFKIFAHDDGSKDGTVKILEDYLAQYPDKISLLEGASTGSAKANFIYLLSQVQAPYYMFCDQDDVWMPDKIEVSMKKMEEIEQEDKDCCAMVYTDLSYVNAKREVISPSYFDYMNKSRKQQSLSDTLKKNMFVGCTLLLNAPLRNEVIVYEDMARIYMHDWWAGLLAVTLGRTGFVDRATIWYRQHDGNVTGNKSESVIVKQFKRWGNLPKGIAFKREYMHQRVLFAKELLAHVPEDNENYLFVQQLSMFDTMGKRRRMEVYEQFHMYEDGKNRLWQSLWI